MGGGDNVLVGDCSPGERLIEKLRTIGGARTEVLLLWSIVEIPDKAQAEISFSAFAFFSRIAFNAKSCVRISFLSRFPPLDDFAGTSGCFRERGRAVYSSISFCIPGCLPWSMVRLRKDANGANGFVSGSDIWSTVVTSEGWIMSSLT